MTKTKAQKARKRAAKSGKKAHPQKKRKGFKVGNGHVRGRGNYVGDIAGGLGNVVGTVLGMGSYKIIGGATPIASGTGPPVFSDGSSNDVIVCHKEMLTTITSSTLFQLISFSINPGLVATFPWLSAIASRYQQYQILGMLFFFKSQSASALNSTNTALGKVIMATNYDVNEPLFTSSQQMENYEYSTVCKPAQDALHEIECAPHETLGVIRKTRTALTLAPNTDIQLYDWGTFQLAVEGMQAAAVIGELWVTYKVRFMKPSVPSPIGGNVAVAHYNFTVTSGGAVYTNPVQIAGSTIPLTFGLLGGFGSVQFVNTGRYLVVHQFANNGGTVTTGGLQTAVGSAVAVLGAAGPFVGALGAATTQTAPGSGSSPMAYLSMWDINSTLAGWQWGAAITTTAATFGVLWVVQVSSGVTLTTKGGRIYLADSFEGKMLRLEAALERLGVSGGSEFQTLMDDSLDPPVVVDEPVVPSGYKLVKA